MMNIINFFILPPDYVHRAWIKNYTYLRDNEPKEFIKMNNFDDLYIIKKYKVFSNGTRYYLM
jgi:hypothetical protein